MHGVNWQGVYDRYKPMVEDCVSREDLSFLTGEMISELNVGHAYYYGGDTEESPWLGVGLPGCDFAVEQGAFRIAKIYRGVGRGRAQSPGRL